jgi:hypothetical protein
VAPAGFATSGTDCDDGDAAVWVSLVYAAVDFDGDGVTAPALGTRCTAGVLLPPYYATPIGSDCDDTNQDVFLALTIFADADHDGIGAGPGQLACTDGEPPEGFSATGTDCDDDDPTLTHLAVRYPDQDGDGVGAPPRLLLCIGTTTPAGFAIGGFDEDDADPAVIETDEDDDELNVLLLGG